MEKGGEVSTGLPKSYAWEDADLSSEKQQELNKLVAGVKRAIKVFSLKRSKDNRKGERLLVITDEGVDELYRRALWEAGYEAGGEDFGMIVVPKTEQAAQPFLFGPKSKLPGADAILLVTSLSRTHSAEVKDRLHPQFDPESVKQRLAAREDRYSTIRERTPGELAELLADFPKTLANKLQTAIGEFPSRTRVVSITNSDPEVLTMGAAEEDPKVTNRRVKEFAEVARNVVKVRVTSENGTDLELTLKKGTLDLDTPDASMRGKVINYPAGEWAWAPNLDEMNGVYVVDGAVGMIGRVKEPIRITFHDGRAVLIEGGKEAERLKQILMEAQKRYKVENPEGKASAFWAAEFSCGMNSKAFRYEQGEKVSPPTSLEAEKGLGTVHIALGKNAIFNIAKNDPDYNDIGVHIDCIAMKPTVIGICEDGREIELVRDGEVTCLK